MLMPQARRTLSGLLKQGKDALRQQDPDEAVLAAKQVNERDSLLPDAGMCHDEGTRAHELSSLCTKHPTLS